MQAEIRDKIRSLNLHIVGLLETRVQSSSHNNSILPSGWADYSNHDICSNARTWILWNLGLVKLSILEVGIQFVHCEISIYNFLFYLLCYANKWLYLMS